MENIMASVASISSNRWLDWSGQVTVAQGSWALSDDGITKEFCCSINLLQKSFLAILHTWIMLGIQQEKMSHQVIATGEQGVN